MIDLSGKTFGRLTVIDFYKKDGKQKYLWNCRCSCGNYCKIDGSSLRRGRTRSCGCLKKESDNNPNIKNRKDLSGQTFNKLTVIKYAGSDKRGESLWECRCICGNTVTVLGSNLRTGHTKSCGCLRASSGELKIANILRENNIKFTPYKSLFKYPNNHDAEFDFYIDDKYVIEFDGEQHFNTNNLHGWAEENFKKVQYYDQFKNQWCIQNEVPIIRIPYTQYDMLNIDDLLLIPNNKFIYYTNIYYNIDDLTKVNYENTVFTNRVNIISCYSLNGDFIKTFYNYDDIKTFLNLDCVNVYNIIKCCKKINKTSYGFQWRFGAEQCSISKIDSNWPIYQFDSGRNCIAIYNSIAELRSAGYDKSCINKVLKGVRKTYSKSYWSINNTLDIC